MMRRVLLLVFILGLLSSCNKETSNKDEKQNVLEDKMIYSRDLEKIKEEGVLRVALHTVEPVIFCIREK